MSAVTDRSHSRWPHRAAIAVAALTLPLIFMGGRVTSTGSGMAVPDWPTTFGENLFTFPLSRWVGPVGIEHSHRIAGAVVGLATILMALVFAFREGRRAVRPLGAVALLLVSVQGVLGGKRVVLYEHGLAPLHGCVAQAFFAFLAVLVAITSARWHAAAPAATPGASRLRRLAFAAAALAYVQVVLGAWYRHVALARIEPHATVGVLLLVLAIALSRSVKRAGSPWLRGTVRRLHAVLGLQLALGVASYFVKPLEVSPDLKVALVSTHLAVGALVVGTFAALAAQTVRGLAPDASVPAPAIEQPEEVAA